MSQRAPDIVADLHEHTDYTRHMRLDEALGVLLRRAVQTGLAGAAILDRDGTVVARAGSIADDTLDAVARLLVRTGSAALAPELADRLTKGEVAGVTIDDTSVFVSIARMCVFVIGVPHAGAIHPQDDVYLLRRTVDDMLDGMLERADTSHRTPPGTPSGPASLPAVELEVTPGVRRGKA